MLLTIDVGNTNIKSALFEAENLKDFKVHSNIEKLNDFFSSIQTKNAAICSVNPSIGKSIYEILVSRGISVFQANIKHKFNCTINYDTPHTLGLDRVCSVAGALQIAISKNLLKSYQYLMTIDFGTATTINIVSPEKEFIGGLIAPGVKTMFRSLSEETVQLPLTDLSSYSGLIGKSTISSIVSGVLNSTLGMINETVNWIKVRSKIEPLIFVTGGNSELIFPHINHKVTIEKALVLRGLKIVYDLNYKIN